MKGIAKMRKHSGEIRILQESNFNGKQFCRSEVIYTGFYYIDFKCSFRDTKKHSSFLCFILEER